LTLHAAYALHAADVVLHDALVAPEILALAGPRARLESVGKRAGRVNPRQAAINARMVALAGRGLRVLRLKGGDPMVFGRGGEEAIALAVAGVPFRIVPGISAGIGGMAYAGIPTTHRTVAPSVTLMTGHGVGGVAPGEAEIRALANGAAVLVLYMGLGGMAQIADMLIEAGRAPDEAVAFVTDATTARQEVRVATLARAGAVAAEIPRRAATLIVIGPVVAVRETLAGWQDDRPMTVARPSDLAVSA
jgi:uroporphyrin-III C-methyltransferase